MNTASPIALKERVLKLTPNLPRYRYVPKVIAWLAANGYENLAAQPNIAARIYNVVKLNATDEAITKALEAITENK